jgi:hypothetical protein
MSIVLNPDREKQSVDQSVIASYSCMEHRISYEICRKEYIPARTTSMYQVIVHLPCQNKHFPRSFDLCSAFSLLCSDSLS